jgi:tRNA(Ile)-lysidine synthase
VYNRFLEFIRHESLFSSSHRLLVGVSGGSDSVALVHLLNRLNNDFAFAHCNFNLRGEEADSDEQFVIKLAEEYGVPCFRSSFPTCEYAAENGVSVEMAARELRYRWFEQIREDNKFDYIVVGHHLDDVLETFMLNLTRETGIRGLTGIKPKAGKVIRPLLFATRKDIENYIEENDLNFCTDRTNADTAYKRNAVRHNILPLFEKLNPAFKKNLQQTIQYLWQTEQVYSSKIEEVRKKVVLIEGDWVKIDTLKLKHYSPLVTYIFELLRPYGFNSEVVETLSQLLIGDSGQQFFSSTHRLVSNRDEWIITPLKETDSQQLFYIGIDDSELNVPVKMTLQVDDYDNNYVIEKKTSVAMLDFDKLSFPLVLRKWHKGEYFKPLGMSGFKKLSDFFIDEKYSIPEKENIWILLSDNKVVWIIGKRIDDRFKITAETEKVLRITIGNND